MTLSATSPVDGLVRSIQQSLATDKSPALTPLGRVSESRVAVGPRCRIASHRRSTSPKRTARRSLNPSSTRPCAAATALYWHS